MSSSADAPLHVAGSLQVVSKYTASGSDEEVFDTVMRQEANVLRWWLEFACVVPRPWSQRRWGSKLWVVIHSLLLVLYTVSYLEFVGVLIVRSVQTLVLINYSAMLLFFLCMPTCTLYLSYKYNLLPRVVVALYRERDDAAWAHFRRRLHFANWLFPLMPIGMTILSYTVQLSRMQDVPNLWLYLLTQIPTTLAVLNLCSISLALVMLTVDSLFARFTSLHQMLLRMEKDVAQVVPQQLWNELKRLRGLQQLWMGRLQGWLALMGSLVVVQLLVQAFFTLVFSLDPTTTINLLLNTTQLLVIYLVPVLWQWVSLANLTHMHTRVRVAAAALLHRSVEVGNEDAADIQRRTQVADLLHCLSLEKQGATVYGSTVTYSWVAKLLSLILSAYLIMVQKLFSQLGITSV